MDVRRVVQKIEWQTWENILVQKGVQGRITLRIRNVPLDEVLRIIADQTSARSSVLYPLYSKGSSLVSLKKALRGELDPTTHGWTNLPGLVSFRPGPRMGAGGPGGEPGRAEAQLMSLQIQEKNVEFAALALDRFAQAHVVPEDGITATITCSSATATSPGCELRAAESP